MIRWPIANYIYVRNVSKCQSCNVTVMTSCFLPLLKFLICIFFTIRSKEHTKGSWNLKKFCPYHKNSMKYGILKYEKNNSAKYEVPPLRKIPKLELFFCSSKCSYVAHVMCQMTKPKVKKKIGIKNYPSGVIALKLVLLRHNLWRHPFFYC